MSTEITTADPDHLIIWLDESYNSNEAAVMESGYKTNTSDFISVQVNDSYAHNTVQLEQEIKKCFQNISEDLRIFHNLDQCQLCIDANVDKKSIFLIISTSTALKIIPCWQESWSSIKKIYILGNFMSNIVDWMDYYRAHGIDILLFDLHKNLLIRLLQDISQYYLAKGKDLKSHVLSNTNLAVPYFGWAKELMIRANQALVLGSAYPPQLFEDEPTLIIFDHDGYLVDPPIDLKPFSRIANIINNQTTFTQRLNYPNRSFIIAIILPQLNQHQVLPFVQQNVLGYPSIQLFYLFFADSNGNNLAANCGPKLIECHSITSRTSAQTRVVCARVNDLNIAYCESHRVQYENQGDNSVANLFAEQKLDRVSLQLKYNQQLRREFEQRLFE
ncbi:unnamed protein product [Adineta steineri]|uniref:Uncharacterized protein n=1 Tax=Adineta steineri TaxID=433720 RepID=A0A815NDV9_9BILA|nr:unnamed protein product [Adineta steineri]